MAFEGLLTKIGPSLVRELSPHVLQLTGSFLERFRKDTSAMKASVDAEIVALRQAHASLATAAVQQADTIASLKEQLVRVEGKIDRLQQGHEMTANQLSVMEEQMRLASHTPAGLLWATFALVLLTLGVVLGLFVLHR